MKIVEHLTSFIRDAIHRNVFNLIVNFAILELRGKTESENYCNTIGKIPDHMMPSGVEANIGTVSIDSAMRKKYPHYWIKMR